MSSSTLVRVQVGAPTLLPHRGQQEGFSQMISRLIATGVLACHLRFAAGT
jgi:hypothetical protein